MLWPIRSVRMACGVVLLLAAMAQAAPVRVACVGDSITEGSGLANPSTESYPARLQRLLGTNSLVRNFGVSGRTLLKRGDFPYWNETAYRSSREFEPAVVLIKLGSNDAKPQNWRHGPGPVLDIRAAGQRDGMDRGGRRDVRRRHHGPHHQQPRRFFRLWEP